MSPGARAAGSDICSSSKRCPRWPGPAIPLVARGAHEAPRLALGPRGLPGRPHSVSTRSQEPAASCRPSSSLPRRAPGLADAAYFRTPRPGLPRSPRSSRSIIPHSGRPGRPSVGGFVQRAFFAHRAAARRHEKALFILGLHDPEAHSRSFRPPLVPPREWVNGTGSGSTVRGG